MPSATRRATNATSCNGPASTTSSPGASPGEAAGTLYVVATPLGHLGDLTARAADTLRQVGVVAAEDTRRARKLLTHIGARPRVISYHAHSRPAVAKAVLALLANGTDVALVTDAGTPAVSDPGAALVAAARALGFRVTPVPGPSAVAAALSSAGLPADRFLFLGFLPRSGRERAALLDQTAKSSWTVVIFEAAPRLGRLLSDLERVIGPDRPAVVTRELTKVHEEFRVGTVGELAGYYAEASVRGEVTLLIAGRGPTAERETDEPRADPAERARELLDSGLSRRDVARTLAEEFGWTRNAAYRYVAER